MSVVSQPHIVRKDVNGGKGKDMQVGGPSGIVPSQEEKTQGTLVWAIGILTWIVPLIFLLISKEKPFVYRNAVQCLTFQVCLFVLMMICIVTVVGILITPFIWLLGLVIGIMGAMAANKGEIYEPPVTGNLAKQWFKI
jgi:uncharacterized membrane protein